MSIILIISTPEHWQKAIEAGQYTADSLATEGFIHCSTPTQVVRVANSRFRGQRGLVLLCVDEWRVQPEVKYEHSARFGEAFPHIYGPLNVDAVVQVVDFPPGPDGEFRLPALP